LEIFGVPDFVMVESDDEMDDIFDSKLYLNKHEAKYKYKEKFFTK
jgi:hypothetical protein